MSAQPYESPYRAIAKDITSAFVGSVACAYVGQPFDTFKVRQQAMSLSIPSTFRSILSESPLAFWKGVVPTTAGMMFENAMAFGLNNFLKRAVPSGMEEIVPGGTRTVLDLREDVAKPMALGAMTGTCSSFVLISSEVIKTRTQLSTTSVPSSQVMKEIMKTRGFSGLWVGMDAQIMRDAPFYAVFFGSYEIFKFTLHNMGVENRDVNYFISGGFAGMVGWFVAMPFDVPKTILQSNPNGAVVGDYFKVMGDVVKTRGVVGGLYAGLAPTLLRAFPSNAALFLGVEWAKEMFDVVIPRR
mmetsp:Transcript_18596/g.37263  ORF Transcript_18596/g.37263 Transcript_18596/m.37263 type:complete len:299 (-) Transcript_18596:481-1377(-)